MDRLVCGDVGFGKTEVAIRAAFKAACDSKQVAVLVPTTVLAFQHYKTFSDRLKNMPVRVDYLSRARTAKQTREVLADLKAGKIDILVGTHKLIGKTVEWHDLGLLIIDEEQKFGVSTKEKLRKLKTNVDTLTMSATPIPRTLQFSLMGARDMSIMRTPPPNRYPVQTELGVYGHEIIADAINFEMSRNGQVFFVNDRINNLPEIAALIKKYVPDARVAIGHGQMSPEELEKILIGFMNYDYDVLLSTTIVENGIDISNANTIIINDAHRFGLSDLHQMRGRVGRSNRKAFCYLLAPPKSVLTPEARRRLEALENFSELGSGFNLAMQDLDIRGAGNLLGAEQSGFMEDLGYETYQKILNQAVTELKNEEFQDIYAEEIAQGKEISGDEFVEDCALESDLEMYFPETYVPGSAERMFLYRELDNISDDDQLDAYRKRLSERGRLTGTGRRAAGRAAAAGSCRASCLLRPLHGPLHRPADRRCAGAAAALRPGRSNGHHLDTADAEHMGTRRCGHRGRRAGADHVAYRYAGTDPAHRAAAEHMAAADHSADRTGTAGQAGERQGSSAAIHRSAGQAHRGQKAADRKTIRRTGRAFAPQCRHH